MLERRQQPGEDQMDGEVVGGVVVLGQDHDLVLEGQQGARVEVEGEVQVERAAAGRLGVEVDLEGLTHRVGLDEVALVVHVEAVLGGVVLQVCDEAGDVDDGHGRSSWFPAGAGVVACWDGVCGRDARAQARSAGGASQPGGG